MSADAAAVRVRIRGLSRRFAAAGGATTALEDIDLDVHANEFVSLLGPSGCGKTTLLRIVGGLLGPTSGEISIDGGTVADALRARKFGVVFQDPTLLPWRTVADNAALLLDVTKQREQARGRARRSSRPSASTASSSTTRRSSRGACASAWRWRGRSR